MQVGRRTETHILVSCIYVMTLMNHATTRTATLLYPGDYVACSACLVVVRNPGEMPWYRRMARCVQPINLVLSKSNLLLRF